MNFPGDDKKLSHAWENPEENAKARAHTGQAAYQQTADFDNKMRLQV